MSEIEERRGEKKKVKKIEKTFNSMIQIQNLNKK
jgi:hypothetical protein